METAQVMFDKNICEQMYTALHSYIFSVLLYHYIRPLASDILVYLKPDNKCLDTS